MTPDSNGFLSVDKDELYGEFLRGKREDRKLMLKAAHKALDIADDDMHVEANKTTGIGALGAAGIALAAGLGPAGLGAAMLWKMFDKPAEKPVPGVDKIIKQNADIRIGKPIVEDDN